MGTKPTVISLFSGALGLDLGLELAGFQIRACIDNMRAACDTIQLNRPKIPTICEDIRKVDAKTILNEARLRKGKAMLVSGGPPCQSFSVLGKRTGLKDPRGKLIYEFIRVVKEAQPQAFLLENVNGLTMSHSQRVAEFITQEFEKLGYKTTRRVLDAVNFGAPQRRRRVFFVGSKHKHIYLNPRLTHGNGKQQTLDGNLLLPPRTVRDAFTNPPLDGLPNHVMRQHGDRVRKRYQSLKPGDRDRTDHTDRLEWNKPAGTLLVGSSAGGGRPHIHPEESRVITVREGARLQTFPDSWVFASSVTDQYRLVGKAVPVVLAEAVGKFLLEHLAKPQA